MDKECQELILQFAASYTLANHLGDIADDIQYLLNKIGFEGEWNSQAELLDLLAEQGITTIYGTPLTSEFD